MGNEDGNLKRRRPPWKISGYVGIGILGFAKLARVEARQTCFFTSLFVNPGEDFLPRVRLHSTT